MTHKHHIIPKHMGGSDSPENLIELTIEEHAEAHRVLFEQYGRLEDELAWKGLSGIVGKEEIVLTLLKENGKKLGLSNKGKPAWNKGLDISDERVLKYCRSGYKITNSENMGRYTRTEETLKKLRKPKTQEHKDKIKIKAKEQWASIEAREEQSKRMKLNRDVCPFCGLESNRSNITRHKKMCKENQNVHIT